MAKRKSEAEKVATLKAAGFKIGRSEGGALMAGSECYRCGGSGRYPSACYNGVCLGCHGPGVIWRTIAKAHALHARNVNAAVAAEKRFAEIAAAEAAERLANGGKTLRELAAEAKAAEAAAVEAARLAELAKSEHLGAEGERIELVATLEHVASFEGRFGWSSVVMLRSGPHAIRWFSASPGELGVAENKGKTFRIAGTVKRHEVFRDERMTHLTRVKVLGEVAEAPAEPAAPVVVKAAPPPPVVNGRCTNPKHDEVREGLYDAAGIFVAYVCNTCEATVKARYRPGLFDESLGDYYRHAAEYGERVDDDY